MPYRQEVKPADYSGPSALEGWVRFDAGWYRSIAEDGYYYRGEEEQSSVAFFPVYPLAMRAFHSVFGGDTAAWGIFITLLAGLTIAVLFYRWCVPRLGEVGARYALAHAPALALRLVPLRRRLCRCVVHRVGHRRLLVAREGSDRPRDSARCDRNRDSPGGPRGGRRAVRTRARTQGVFSLPRLDRVRVAAALALLPLPLRAAGRLPLRGAARR